MPDELEQEIAELEKEAAAQETEEAPAPVEAPQPEKTVPLAALHEERAKIREMREQMAVMQQRLGNLDAVEREIMAMRQQRQQPQIPSMADDPLGHLQERLNQSETVLKQVAQIEQFRSRQDQEAQKMQQIAATVSQAEVEFMKQAPDYYNALNYLRELKTKELASVGVTDPGAIAQHINKGAWELSLAAMQNGRSPAQAAYELAKSYGYQPQSVQPTGQRPVGDLQSVAGGLATNRTLNRGGAPEGNVSVEELLGADGDEFAAKWEQLFGKKLK